MRTTTLSAAAHLAVVVLTLSVPARGVAQPAKPTQPAQAVRTMQFSVETWPALEHPLVLTPVLLASVAVVLVRRPGGSLATWWHRRSDR